MSLDLGRALTGGNINKSTVSDFVVCIYSSLLLHIFADIIDTIVKSANSVDPSQEQSNWVHNVCVYLVISHICSRQHKQMTFSGDIFSSA